MRLIDADAFELNVQNEWERNEISNGDWILFRQLINEEPTIDAVSVVRCKDCKHMYRTIFCGSIYNNCGKRTEHVDPEGYCEQGER